MSALRAGAPPIDDIASRLLTAMTGAAGSPASGSAAGSGPGSAAGGSAAGAEPPTLVTAPFPAAAAVTEHLGGVLPLLGLLPGGDHPTVAAARDGSLPTALALSTANAELLLSAPAVTARAAAADGVVLDGRCRIAWPAVAALVAAVPPATTPAAGDPGAVPADAPDGAAVGTAVLCLVRLDAPGVRVGDAGWIDLDGVAVEAALVSAPTALADPRGPVVRALDGLAWRHTAHAHRHARGVVADLRRVLATTATSGPVFATSQYLAHELTRLDIELSLLGDAIRLGPGLRAEPPGGVAVAALRAACADVQHRVDAVADDLEAELGLPRRAHATPHPHLGGRRMAEAELARRMGLLTGSA